MKRFFALIAAWLIAATHLTVFADDLKEPENSKDAETSRAGMILQAYCEDTSGEIIYFEGESPEVSGDGKKRKIYYPGTTQAVIHTENPDIYVKLKPGADSNKLRLIPLKASKKERQYLPVLTVYDGTSDPFSIMPTLMKEDLTKISGKGISIEVGRRSDDLYRIMPMAKLKKKGHYAVIYAENTDLSKIIPVIYAFEVKK